MQPQTAHRCNQSAKVSFAVQYSPSKVFHRNSSAFWRVTISPKWNFFLLHTTLARSEQHAEAMALREQLLYNKSPQDGKLFPLEVKRQSIIIKRDSFILRLFSAAKVESKAIRVIEDLCKLLVSEIKRQICVGNWANKQFVTERHAAELDYERRDMCKGKVRQCCRIRPVASSEAMRI